MFNAALCAAWAYTESMISPPNHPDHKLLGALLIAAVLVLGVVAVGSSFPALPEAEAGLQHNMYGWAWSDTIGWVSFNCTDTGDCSPDYGVSVDDDPSTGTGLLSGYAWSDTIGWISFGDYDGDGDIDSSDINGGCPSGSPCEARLGGVNPNEVRGWARALAADPAQGWDGWISLDCATAGACNGGATQYGVTFDGTDFHDYAWGSDVVGWISFNCAEGGANGEGVCDSQTNDNGNYKVSKGTPPQATVTLDANPTTIGDGGQTTLQWGAANVSTCTAGGEWSGQKVPPLQSSEPVTNIAGLGPHTFTLSCTGPYGPASDDAVVTVAAPDFQVNAGADITMNFVGTTGASASRQVRVVPLYGFAETVDFDALSITPQAGSPPLPGWVTITPAPPAQPSSLSSANYSDGWTLQVTATQPFEGTYLIEVVGNSSTLARPDDLLLVAKKVPTGFENF